MTALACPCCGQPVAPGHMQRDLDAALAVIDRAVRDGRLPASTHTALAQIRLSARSRRIASDEARL